MNTQQAAIRTESGAAVRTTNGRRSARRQVAPALVTCPRCGCGEYADAIASGDCLGCKRAAKVARKEAQAA